MCTRALVLTFGILLMTACAGHETYVRAPLTPHSVQEARVHEKSAQNHTVLMTLTGNELPQARDLSSTTDTDEPGDGDAIALGSNF